MDNINKALNTITGLNITGGRDFLLLAVRLIEDQNRREPDCITKNAVRFINKHVKASQ